MFVASISLRVGELVDVTELMAMGLLLVAGDAALGANGSIPSYLGMCTGEFGQSFILQGRGYRRRLVQASFKWVLADPTNPIELVPYLTLAGATILQMQAHVHECEELQRGIHNSNFPWSRCSPGNLVCSSPSHLPCLEGTRYAQLRLIGQTNPFGIYFIWLPFHRGNFTDLRLSPPPMISGFCGWIIHKRRLFCTWSI